MPHCHIVVHSTLSVNLLEIKNWKDTFMPVVTVGPFIQCIACFAVKWILIVNLDNVRSVSKSAPFWMHLNKHSGSFQGCKIQCKADKKIFNCLSPKNSTHFLFYLWRMNPCFHNLFDFLIWNLFTTLSSVSWCLILRSVRWAHCRVIRVENILTPDSFNLCFFFQLPLTLQTPHNYIAFASMYSIHWLSAEASKSYSNIIFDFIACVNIN